MARKCEEGRDERHRAVEISKQGRLVSVKRKENEEKETKGGNGRKESYIRRSEMVREKTDGEK
jgi:hypothetical protein